MRGEFLLDTNIVVALLAGEDTVCQRLTNESGVFVSSIVVGELYYGARKSKQVEENLARITKLTTGIAVLGCDLGTAQEYSLIKNELRLKGRPIPENDIWIAAIARQYGLRLVSRDTHFAEVDELTWEKW